MSEAKFTKGPWVAYISPVKLNQGYTSVECNSGVIYGEPMYKSSEIEDTANAHLIAAAPEMYRELKDIADNHTESPYQEELYRLLAKARGEA